MSRLTIQLPETFRFTTELPVCIGHINYANHLDNVALLSLVSEARVRYLASFGCTELDIDGVGLVVSETAVRYRAEAHYGEVLVIKVAPADFWACGCNLYWQVCAREDGREIAHGRTGLVFFDYARSVKAGVPGRFLAAAGVVAG